MNLPHPESIRQMKDKLLRQQGVLEDLEERIEDKENDFYLLNKQLDISFGALEVIREAAKLTQVQFLQRLSEFCTQCVQSVFGSDYRYELTLEDRGKGLIPQHCLWKGDKELSNPVSSVGGGVIDVLAFSLRVACLRLLGKTAGQVLLLDEAFKCLSEDLQPKIASMLMDISSNLGIQIIMISHEETLVNSLVSANMIRIGD